MGLFGFKSFDDKVYKSLSKLKDNGQYEYDHILAPSYLDLLRNQFTREMLINSVWYSANDLRLKQLYEKDLSAIKVSTVSSDELNYFWAQPTGDLGIRKIHSGLPQLIASKMADIIMGNGYSRKVYKDKELKEQDDILQERLDTILEFNNEHEQLQSAMETESWGGGVAFKLAFIPNSTLLKYPVIEVIQPDEYEPVIFMGRIVGDIFIKYIEENKNVYKLKEHYGTDEDGTFIKFSLWKYNKDVESWSEVDIKSCQETKDLEDWRYDGFYEKFSIYKPNKTPNSLFKGSKLGESDFSGCHGLFDAYDETLSSLVQEFRDGKIKNFWPSNLLPTDPTTQKQYLPATLKKDFMVFTSGIGEKEKPVKPEMIQGDIHAEKYISSARMQLELICNNCGLSPQTLGITGLDSTAASADSQELREKASIRTGMRKKQAWKPVIEKLYELVLQMDDIKNGKQPQEYYVNVTFNDYKVKTLKDKLVEAQMAITSGAWDMKKAIEYVNEDLTDEEKDIMRVMVKIEKGMNTFTQEEQVILQKYITEKLEEIKPITEDTPLEV